MSRKDVRQGRRQTEPFSELPGQFSLRELAEILSVSTRRLRHWVRLGLLAPTDAHCVLAQFDFGQVLLAKRIWEFVSQGIPLATIRRALPRLKRWFPEVPTPLARIVRCAPRGQLLVRVNERLVDLSGQEYFDFAARTAPRLHPTPHVKESRTAEDLFQQALAQEDAGELKSAIATYQKALALDPQDAVLHFNLGNNYWGVGEVESALGCYRQAVHLDPQFAEAWNNLGNVYAHLQQQVDALKALRRAMHLVCRHSATRHRIARCLHKLEANSEPAMRVFPPRKPSRRATERAEKD